MPDLDFSILATLRKPIKIDRRTVNLIGRKFNQLTPLGLLGFGGDGAVWLCRCDCGSFFIATTVNKLFTGATKSCGCYGRNRLGNKNRTHGQSHSKLHSLWGGIHSRCYNPKIKRYKDYGGRGIRVVERWHNFENFRDDVGERPEGMTIERIDNNGDYGPDNFRWATRQEQSYNKRNNRLATYNNETKCVAEWSAVSGLSRHVITDALNRGESLEELFSNPTRNEQRARYVTANGETHRISEWALIRNMPRYQIQRNLDRYGMTPDEALGFVQRTV